MKRSELFGIVWREPLATLAPKLGMSKPTLLKLCRMHNVPVPGRGHWAKVRAGQGLAPEALPEADDIEVDIVVNGRPSGKQPSTDSAEINGNKVPLRFHQVGSSVEDLATLSSIELLLELSLNATQAAATSAYLVRLLLMTNEMDLGTASVVYAWVSRQNRLARENLA